MIYIYYVVFAFLGYLLGSLNFSIIIGKIFYKTDVRDSGSHNAGATNTLRTLGRLPAVLVVVFDALKGVIAFFAAYLITKNHNIAYISAVTAILGHNFPVYFGFRGGKGVCASLGALLCFNPLLGALAALIGVVVIVITKYVSAGSIIGAASAIIIFMIFDFSPIKLILVVIIAALLIFRHSQNIKRLINGTENKIKV